MLGRDAVVPRGLDQQPPRVPRPGLRDRAEPALLPGRLLAGNQSDIAHQLLGAGEPLEVADLAHSPTAVSVSTPRRHRNRPTCTTHGELGQHRDDLALQLFAAVAQRVDRAARVEHRRLRCRPRPA